MVYFPEIFYVALCLGKKTKKKKTTARDKNTIQMYTHRQKLSLSLYVSINFRPPLFFLIFKKEFGS